MIKTSIRLDPELKKLLDDYCLDTGLQPSHAIRSLVRDGIKLFNKSKQYGFIENVGPNGLMVNQKYAIRSSIESLYLLRTIASKITGSDAILEEVNKKASQVMAEGWAYDNKD